MTIKRWPFILGIPLLLSSLFLFYSSFVETKYYLNDGEFYSHTDAIGVEYFLKEIQFTSAQVGYVILASFIISLFILVSANFLDDILKGKIKIIKLIFMVVIIALFYLGIDNYTGTFTFLHNKYIFLSSGVLSLFLLSFLDIKIYYLITKSPIVIFILFLYFCFGLSLFTEIGNYIQPYFHEGNWGQVDGNFITIFFNDYGSYHTWTFSYLAFRVTNWVIIILVTSVFVKNKNLEIAIIPSSDAE